MIWFESELRIIFIFGRLRIYQSSYMEYFLASVVLFRAWMFWTPLEFVKKLKLSSKYLLLCSVEERKSYDFETEGWVNWHNLHSWNTSWHFHVMHTFLHVLLGIWHTFGRVQRIRRLWFVSYTYVFFQTDRLCWQFCTCSRLQIFLGFSNERCKPLHCVCVNWLCLDAVQSVIWGPAAVQSDVMS